MEENCACGGNCNCEKSEFNKLFEKYAKVVWCKDYECKYNVAIEGEPHFVDRGPNHVPFSDDSYKGVCGRNDVAVRPMKMWENVTNKTNQVITGCTVRADKSLNRPKLPDPDKIEGGSYDDPKGPDWSTSAYGLR